MDALSPPLLLRCECLHLSGREKTRQSSFATSTTSRLIPSEVRRSGLTSGQKTAFSPRTASAIAFQAGTLAPHSFGAVNKPSHRPSIALLSEARYRPALISTSSWRGCPSPRPSARPLLPRSRASRPNPAETCAALQSDMSVVASKPTVMTQPIYASSWPRGMRTRGAFRAATSEPAYCRRAARCLSQASCAKSGLPAASQATPSFP